MLLWTNVIMFFIMFFYANEVFLFLFFFEKGQKIIQKTKKKLRPFNRILKYSAPFLNQHTATPVHRFP